MRHACCCHVARVEAAAPFPSRLGREASRSSSTPAGQVGLVPAGRTDWHDDTDQRRHGLRETALPGSAATWTGLPPNHRRLASSYRAAPHATLLTSTQAAP